MNAKLEEGFSEENDALVERVENEHKYFSVVCGKLEKKSVDETARLEEGVLDRFGRLERKFAEVDEKRMIQEMKISLAELVTKLDKKKVTKENAAMSKRFTEGIAKIDKKYRRRSWTRTRTARTRAATW